MIDPHEQRTCHWCGRRGRGSGGRRPGQADCPRFRLKPARGLNARMGVAGPRPSAGRCSRQEVAKTADASLTWWIDIRAFRDRCRPAKAFCINKGLNLAEKPQARGFRPSCCICTRAPTWSTRGLVESWLTRTFLDLIPREQARFQGRHRPWGALCQHSPASRPPTSCPHSHSYPQTPELHGMTRSRGCGRQKTTVYHPLPARIQMFLYSTGSCARRGARTRIWCGQPQH